jgi:hypothetical protein
MTETYAEKVMRETTFRITRDKFKHIENLVSYLCKHQLAKYLPIDKRPKDYNEKLGAKEIINLSHPSIKKYVGFFYQLGFAAFKIFISKDFEVINANTGQRIKVIYLSSHDRLYTFINITKELCEVYNFESFETND